MSEENPTQLEPWERGLLLDYLAKVSPGFRAEGVEALAASLRRSGELAAVLRLAEEDYLAGRNDDGQRAEVRRAEVLVVRGGVAADGTIVAQEAIVRRITTPKPRPELPGKPPRPGVEYIGGRPEKASGPVEGGSGRWEKVSVGR